MTPVSLVDILDEHLKSSLLDAKSIALVAVLILGVGIFSFALIFTEVRYCHSFPRCNGLCQNIPFFCIPCKIADTLQMLEVPDVVKV